jgi:hypothetical protein
MTNFVPVILVFTISINSTTATVTWYNNGSRDSWVGTIASNTSVNLGKIDIGNWFASSTPMYGGIASLIIYNSVLSDSQRQLIEGYLAYKWWNNTNKLTTEHHYYKAPVDDIGYIFNPNSMVINTGTCTLSGKSTITSKWDTIYTIQYISYSMYSPVSCQQFYDNNSTQPLNAKLTLVIDDLTNAIYINNVDVISYNQYNFYSGTVSMNIIFLPGRNILDFHCQNIGGPGGLAFYVTNTDGSVLLTQSDANVKCRLL